MMRKRKKLQGMFFMLLVLALVMGCGGREDIEKGQILQVDAEKALEVIEGGSVILVDVRTKEEFASGHIPGSIHIPLDSLEKEVVALLDPEEVDVMVYCRSGVRSAQAASLLLELGYDPVYDLGGILQ